MSGLSSIQWTDRVWNPVVGCTKVSQGCKHCYAKTLHDKRHKAFLEGKIQNMPQYAAPFETVQLMPGRLKDPLSWRKPSRVFVNSVSDLFHDDVPDAFIAEVFVTIAEAERHTFQILTKRPERMLRWFTEYLPEACSGEQPAPVWPLPNVWLGVSVENQAAAYERIPLLLETPAAIRFLSCEPLLGRVDLSEWMWGRTESCGECPRDADCACGFETRRELGLPSIDWTIIGGESGAGARAIDLAFIRDLLRQCRNAGVAPFVKQLGARPYCDASLISFRGNTPRLPHDGYRWLRDKHGGNIEEWPEDLRVREFPAPIEATV
jgi:protein gp37